jgi:long-chain acyl-CoA synthetase
VTTWRDDPRLAQLEAMTATMTGPGQPFEVVTETVLGETMTVFTNRKRSLREVLQGASAAGDGDCYVFGDGRRIRYDEIERQAASIAATLAETYGIGPGDRVAVCAANCPEWIQLFWAVASMNGVLVAMNGWWTAGEMRNALDLTEPALVVMDERRLSRLGSDVGAPTVVIERDFASLLDRLDAPLATEQIHEDDPFMLIFTSGTTGRPKAAALSHRCVIGYLQLQSFLGARGLAIVGRTPGAGPKRLAPFPLFHVSGLSATVSTLLGGGTTVWPVGRFDPDEVGWEPGWVPRRTSCGCSTVPRSRRSTRPRSCRSGSAARPAPRCWCAVPRPASPT